MTQPAGPTIEAWQHNGSCRRVSVEKCLPPYPGPAEADHVFSDLRVLAQYAVSPEERPCGMPELRAAMQDAIDAGGLTACLWLRHEPDEASVRLTPGLFRPDPERIWDDTPFGAVILDVHRMAPAGAEGARARFDVEARAWLAYKRGDVYWLDEAEYDPHSPLEARPTGRTGPYYGLDQARQALADHCGFDPETLDCKGWRRLSLPLGRPRA